MKRTLFAILLNVAVVSVSLAENLASDDCPWFDCVPEWGNSVSYNLNADPWNFELCVYGDTTGANIKWYTFDSRNGQTLADTVLYTGKGSNTVSACCPGTNINYRNTYLDYVCVIKTAACPEGVVSPWCDAQVARSGDCWTSSSHSITVSGVKTYTERTKLQLKAYFGASGGHHHFVWYHNGLPVDTPEYVIDSLNPGVFPAGIPSDKPSVIDYKDAFNYSYLTIPNCELTDSGTWQVRVWDGIDINGDTCWVSSPVYKIKINPVTQCPVFNWLVNGNPDLTQSLTPGQEYAISVYTTEPNPTADPMPSPSTLTITGTGVSILDTTKIADTLTVRIAIDASLTDVTPVSLTATTNKVGDHYRDCSDNQSLTITPIPVGCDNLDSATFVIQSAPTIYAMGDAIALEAICTGDATNYEYCWTLNGDTILSSPSHLIEKDPNNPNRVTLYIPACAVEDGGVYVAKVQEQVPAGPLCFKQSAPITIQVAAYLVFDNNNGTNVWSDAKNWWPKYNRLPNATDSAIIRSQCQVDMTSAQVRDLTFELNTQPALTVLPQGALTIVGALTNPKAGDIVIQASKQSNGSLILSSANTDIPATVEFYALSKDMNNGLPVWQYMGYPLQDSPAFSTAYPGALLYEWTNIPNEEVGGNWQQVNGTIAPFAGYCMTENAEQLYTFSGLLNNPGRHIFPVALNDLGEYPNFAFLANSWVAPIDIARLDPNTFGQADATIYIMNTGTYAQAKDQQSAIDPSGMAIAPGQYNAIPVQAASYLPQSLSKIPSMQGFFVHSTAQTSITMDYLTAVLDTAAYQASAEPTRAPGRRAASTYAPQLYTISVQGFGAADQVYLLTDNSFSPQFENGWDGYQLRSKSPVHLSVLSEEGHLSVAAIPQIEGTELHFEGANDKYYTLTISTPESSTSNLYLWDKERDTYTPFVNGSQYQFTASSAAKRFAIVRQEQQIEPASQFEKFIHRGVLYIRHNGVTYTAQGHLL